MTDEERISNLQSFGYSRDEAGFLALVALHSGYFVRRQFDVAIGVNRGKRTYAFTEKLLARGHARRFIFERNRQVFQLQYKPFYEAVGDEDSRNRREHQPQTIKARLMALDFVQANPQNCFLATERQKLSFLTQVGGLSREMLPAKVYRAAQRPASVTRFFVDRFPIFVIPAHDNTTNRFAFTYIDSGFETTSAFVTHLRHYKPVFEALGDFDLVYVGTNRSRFGEAEATFDRVLSGERGQSILARDLDRMLVYFDDWNTFERGQSKTFSRDRMDRLRDARNEFASPFHEGLFERWKQGGDAAVRAELAAKMTYPRRFLRYVLPFDYDLFGTLEVAS
jgi:hypothetical protein